jgi:hypothetical protein
LTSDSRDLIDFKLFSPRLDCCQKTGFNEQPNVTRLLIFVNDIPAERQKQEGYESHHRRVCHCSCAQMQTADNKKAINYMMGSNKQFIIIIPSQEAAQSNEARYHLD